MNRMVVALMVDADMTRGVGQYLLMKQNVHFGRVLYGVLDDWDQDQVSRAA